MIVNYDYDNKDIDKALMGDPTETALVKMFFKEAKEARRFYKMLIEYLIYLLILLEK